MYQQVVTSSLSGILEQPAFSGAAIARSGQLDALVALEQIGRRRSFSRNEGIYAEGDASDCWYRVVSGAVRICKWMADGRRHIAEFCFAGDCFGLPASGLRAATAEAIGDVVVMRYPHGAADRLIDETPRLAREMYDRTLRELTQTQTHTLVLSRMTASERLASFLLELAERRDMPRAFDLPMSRYDIADYLGLTMETCAGRSQPSDATESSRSRRRSGSSCATARRSKPCVRRETRNVTSGALDAAWSSWHPTDRSA